MKKLTLILLLGCLAGSCLAGPVRFRLEFQPLGGIYASNAEMEITKTAGFTTQTYSINDGAGAYLGSLQVGAEIDTKIGYLDLLGGGGLLVLPGSSEGNIPTGGAFLVDIGYRFKLNKKGSITIGPFVGFIAPGDSTLELEDDTGGTDDTDSFDMRADGGFQGGLKFTAGGEHVGFNMKVGYAQLTYDVIPEDDPNWVITYGGDDELDMSGFFAQFGVCAQF